LPAPDAAEAFGSITTLLRHSLAEQLLLRLANKSRPKTPAATKASVAKPCKVGSRRRPLPFLGAFRQEIQNIRCLFARWLSLALCPSGERLLRNPNGLGYFGRLLDDDVSIVSKRGELFFGRLHNSTIPEIATTCETGSGTGTLASQLLHCSRVSARSIAMLSS
jgi:hypothetical protein